ncbi:hypothetical protein COBT_003441 [Conglomerata obtusa]
MTTATLKKNIYLTTVLVKMMCVTETAVGLVHIIITGHLIALYLFLISFLTTKLFAYILKKVSLYKNYLIYIDKRKNPIRDNLIVFATVYFLHWGFVIFFGAYLLIFLSKIENLILN